MLINSNSKRRAWNTEVPLFQETQAYATHIMCKPGLGWWFEAHLPLGSSNYRYHGT